MSCASELRLERFCLEAMKLLKTKRGIAVKRERARHEPRHSLHLKQEIGTPVEGFILLSILNDVAELVFSILPA